MLEKMKPQFIKLKKGKARCAHCKRRSRGDFVVYIGRTTPSVYNTPAYRIFFVCVDWGHLTFIGYNKPVDFNLNLPKVELDDKSYEDEDQELEGEWAEMVENAQKRRRTFYGR